MVVPCKRSIFLLSSAMMLWSSVMRSSYRSVVRSWTSSCSLMRWDCSHWNQENKRERAMSGHTYRLVILSFIASVHHNFNNEHAQDKTYACSLTSNPERHTEVQFYNVNIRVLAYHPFSLWGKIPLPPRITFVGLTKPPLFLSQEAGKGPKLGPSDAFFGNLNLK